MPLTLRGSYELLGPDDRRLLRQRAVFAGGWTLVSAEAVCDGDALTGLRSLVARSLVQSHDSRFTMLHAVREYALAQLETSGEAELLRRPLLGAFADAEGL
jgi:predicted ATPase